MSKEKHVLGAEAIYDARTLGLPKMLILGLQHMFAMFGATVLVPILVSNDYGMPLSVQTTLFFAGIGTLIFHAEDSGLPGFVLCFPGWFPGCF